MKSMIIIAAFALLLACGQAPVKPESSNAAPPPASEPKSTMTLTSPAFADNEVIPEKYTGKDTNASPALNWYDPPKHTKAFALIVEDPDAPMGTFTHWVAYNIPGTAKGMPEGYDRQEIMPDGTRQLKNDADRVGYFGPLPPPGKIHHYVFTLYALDQELNPVSDKLFLIRALQGHILGEAKLTGTYQR